MRAKQQFLASAAIVGLMFSAETVQAQTQQNETSVLEEIVVTARKREENLQDVPAAITALGGEALDKMGAAGLEDIVRLAPGLAAGEIEARALFAEVEVPGQQVVIVVELADLIQLFDDGLVG